MAVRTYPEELPGTALTPFSVHEDVAYRSNNGAVGPVAFRKLTNAVVTAFNVTWLLDEFDYQVFEGWYNYTLNQGVDPFTILLPVGSGPKTHLCIFDDGYTERRQGRYMIVTALLLADSKQFNDDTDPAGYAQSLINLTGVFAGRQKWRQLLRLANLITFVGYIGDRFGARNAIPDALEDIIYGTGEPPPTAPPPPYDFVEGNYPVGNLTHIQLTISGIAGLTFAGTMSLSGRKLSYRVWDTAALTTGLYDFFLFNLDTGRLLFSTLGIPMPTITGTQIFEVNPAEQNTDFLLMVAGATESDISSPNIIVQVNNSAI